MRLTLLLPIALCIPTVLPASPEDPWPAARRSAAGDANMQSNHPIEIPEWHYEWKAKQRYKPGQTVWASPALAMLDGRPIAFLGGYDQTLHALDLVNTRILWRRMTNAEIVAPPAVGYIRGRLAVFLASNDRTLYALDAQTGTTLWTRELEPARPTLGEAEMTAPLLFEERLYVGGFVYDRSIARNEQRGWLYVLHPEDGTLRARVEVSRGYVSEPIGFRIHGTPHVAICARKGLLQCFTVETATPQLRWTYQMPHEVMGAPAVWDQDDKPVLVLGSKFGNLIALDAATGRERWKRMAGNWFDNSACIGVVEGEPVVFAGSHDYNVYALRAADGHLIWRRALGGEIYSAPAFFHLEGRPHLLIAALDNHLHLLDARTGRIVTSYYTGRPIWDKINKGENRWGSPAVVEAGSYSVLIHGAFNNTVYVLPLGRPATLQARARSFRGLWLSLGAVALLFFSALPLLYSPQNRNPSNNRDSHASSRPYSGIP